MFVRIHFLIATVILLLSAHFSFAQTATVTGMVRDSAGMPVEGALIAYQGSTNAVYTDGAGKFSIEVPADKNVILTINRLGYSESRRTVNVNSGESLNVAINLSTNNTLGTQVVVSNRIFDPGIPIPPRVFDHLPSPSGDITAILRFAGATSNNELSTQYMVRGGNFDENLVYINGIEIYRPILTRAGQQEGLSFPNPDMTENIMFSAGGFEAKYGDKMSSVLDVRYKRPTRFRSTLSMSLLGINVSAEGISEDTRFTWMIGIRQKSNRYLLRSLDTKGDYVASYTDAQGLFTYDITDNWTLQYLGGMSMNKYNLIPATRETDFGTLNNALRFTVYFEGQVLNKFQTQFHSLSLNYAGAGNWTHRWTASVFNSYETETFDVLGQYYIDQLEADFGKPTFGQVAFNRGVGSFLNHARNYLDAWITNGEYQGSWYGDKNTFTYGFKYQHERIVDELSEWNYVDSSGYSVPFYPLESFDLQDVVKSRAQLYSNRITLPYYTTNLPCICLQSVTGVSIVHY